jgi:outer membrane lipoprotein-sorting protein
MRYTLPLALFFAVFIALHPFAKSQTAFDITQTMFTQTKKIQTLQYTMKKLERIKGALIMQQSTVKLNLNPFKVYLIQDAPKQGIEVLYVSGTNNNHALINPNGFPWISINLDPYGSTMRTNQHHTLLNSGYEHVVGILEYLFQKHAAEIQRMMKTEGSVVWDKHACWAISVTNPHFKYIPYTVLTGETIISIANKFHLSEHMIVEKNPGIDSYTDVTAGQIIQIPSDYSNKMILYIDKARHIPLVMKVYDDKGLYEQYEYTKVTVNPVFKQDEFSRDYKDYHF